MYEKHISIYGYGIIAKWDSEQWRYDRICAQIENSNRIYIEKANNFVWTGYKWKIKTVREKKKLWWNWSQNWEGKKRRPRSTWTQEALHAISPRNLQDGDEKPEEHGN